jgi:hypothetical protein
MSDYIMVTPYYKEPESLLRRCIESVKSQSVSCDHLLVADGFPQDWINNEPVRHLVLDKAHADFGDTPRGLGGLLAVAENYQGIGFLDADNWLESNHVESCLKAAGELENCDYVMATRNFCRPDGSIMPTAEEKNHVDTNCYFFLKGSFSCIAYWAMIPKPLAPVCDRVFYQTITTRPFNAARTQAPTVNYLNTWQYAYLEIGETPPEGTKPNVDALQISKQARSRVRSPRDAELENRLVGFPLFQAPA